MSDPGQALVLSGGGASGAYTVGVLRALLEGASPSTGYQALDPGILTGTSIGSFLASFLVSHWRDDGSAADLLRDLWLAELSTTGRGDGAFRMRANPLELLRPGAFFPNPLRPLQRLVRDLLALGRHGATRVRRFWSRHQGLSERFMELADASGLMDLEPWRRILRDAIDYESIRRSPKLLRIAATAWADGGLRLYGNDEMSDEIGPAAIEASCAVPGFLPPVRVGSEHFIDGSIRMYSPVLPAVQAGGRVLHLAYMNVDVGSTPVDGLENSIETLFRSLVIFWAAAVERDVRRAESTNRILELASHRGRHFSESELETLLAAVGPGWSHRETPAAYAPLTVHRYFPRTGFDGTLSFTDMHRNRMAKLIEQGYEETVQHDCESCQCVLPLQNEQRGNVRAIGE